MEREISPNETTSDKTNLGAWGEAVAREYLEKKGFQFLEFGFRSRYGEIDIIMRDKQCIVFIEVKLRKNRAFAEAREFVTREKQKKIRLTALWWIKTRRNEAPCRFDIVEVYAPQGVKTAKPEIIHLPEAFM